MVERGVVAAINFKVEVFFEPPSVGFQTRLLQLAGNRFIFSIHIMPLFGARTGPGARQRSASIAHSLARV